MSAAVGYDTRYDPDADFDAWYTDATADAIARLTRPEQRVLELGCATGRMSARLADGGIDLVGVDRSGSYLAVAADRGLARARWVEGDIEEHVRTDPSHYHHVLATNVLHELDDPERFVAAAGERLLPGGLLHLTLQNPGSLHRLVAREMGLIDDLGATSDRGLRFGTRRSLTRDELVTLGTSAGLRLRMATGLCLKPMPNAWMATLPPEVLEGFVRVAARMPEVAAVNYVVLTRA